ncbi:tyrosine-type recombinase/integrase [Halogeometricum borinquense]|uniref:Site-specific Recombinase XerD n=1 Tax=Halogeometricum borinquense (strain ATCC 700274 / DSM 11551 / JCM 10706 / KCTC 4070 / PR3) TaxID=469382 RepID=E4NP32_HALBP|nr:tyrosine-type recombinase/integrase [Halogeometricum borinquense]ADQ67573.1 site-specific recombinase XerD [Halogeometricum borinquense DSM 11551]ELY23747.1 site-specific recombinase xerd [Halogeometricum borinquense DSM 11551]QIQ76810.1 tyrosine-type recombinase/integrase [Halogeometricum borinquense]
MSEIDTFQQHVSVKQTEGTANRYASAIRRYRDWLDERGVEFGDANQDDVESHLLDLADEDYAKGSLKIARAGIAKFYDEMYDYNPVEDVSIGSWTAVKKGSKKSQSLRDDVHYLTPDEVQQLVDNVHSPPKLRNELIIKMLFQTGMRRGELCKVKLHDVNREERSIRIHADKTHSNRTVYYQPSLSTPLNIWIDAERNGVLTADDSPHLFPTQKAEHIKPNSVSRIVREAAEEAGIQEVMYHDKGGRPKRKITGHTLRHSFAVAALKNGMDVRTLQKLMGHADIETTQMYLDLADDDVKTKARQFGPSLES